MNNRELVYGKNAKPIVQWCAYCGAIRYFNKAFKNGWSVWEFPVVATIEQK
jgi:hypothetical protein